MSIDTIVYEKHNSAATLALMEDGNLLELILRMKMLRLKATSIWEKLPVKLNWLMIKSVFL